MNDTAGPRGTSPRRRLQICVLSSVGMTACTDGAAHTDADAPAAARVAAPAPTVPDDRLPLTDFGAPHPATGISAVGLDVRGNFPPGGYSVLARADGRIFIDMRSAYSDKTPYRGQRRDQDIGRIETQAFAALARRVANGGFAGMPIRCANTGVRDAAEVIVLVVAHGRRKLVHCTLGRPQGLVYDIVVTLRDLASSAHWDEQTPPPRPPVELSPLWRELHPDDPLGSEELIPEP
ncbi:MAG: hypothetical protein K0V04_29970 [Deltaproteobacteria bacterium]|nr:hypothetical protein [Deltaproteobacteria bacterium]